MAESYLVPAGYGEGRYEDRKSKFIGDLYFVESQEQAIELLNEVKAKYRDARHHCYAYIIREGNYMRYSDDGEPQGTAGMPMLDVLRRENLTNVLCVVTRYFGGVLLGTGGLVRAYSHGAKIAVDAASRKLMTTCVLLGMEFDYSFYGKINYLLPKYVCRVEESDFGALVQMKILFKQTEVEAFLKEVTELSAALVVPQVLEERFDYFEA